MTIERLPNGAMLLQDDRFLKLSVDSILLAAACPPAKRVCDLGCGVGNVLVAIADRQPQCELVGLELNHDAAEICRLSVERNSLGQRARVLVGDLREVADSGEALPYGLAAHSFDVVVCNPPYLRAGSGKRSPDPARSLERVDATAPPRAVVHAAGQLLCEGGRLLLVLRTERLEEYLDTLRAEGFSPAHIKHICHRAGTAPTLVLISSVLGVASAEIGRSTLELTDGDAPSPEYQAILEGKPCSI